ncbi:MAG: DNA2/NAM7 family helicase [Selenomonadaceae bacterium]|nr:DNA2/NAM7 family helicase [Selenomonadaceae bacterium]
MSSNLTPEEKRLINMGKKLEEWKAKGFDADRIDKLINKIINPPQKPKPIGKKLTPDIIHDSDSATMPFIKPPDVFKPDDNPDADDFLPAVIDYSKELEKIKEKSANEQEKIKQLEELQQKLLATKYSFGWFKALLDLEIFYSNENKSNSKEISISFRRVEFDTGTQRTLILKYPNRDIPQFMEELENIELVLYIADNIKKVEIEVAAVRNYTLSVKLKDNYKLNNINLNDVVEATITANNPVFLLEELREQFHKLDLPDDYDMRENLCDNIEFVFGPPGTGKTHNLAQKIIALMSERENKKILVLTPTNKAADVIVNKIIELDTDKAYKNWLLRFGTTKDENIEKNGVFQDKTFDIHSKRKNVTVTTIARFPYDFFMPNGQRIYLREMDWDYIIIDEASMIMLVQILLPLYKKTPKKFIIAGDPFQIEPVTKADHWKDENIYTLVKLKSFDNPKTGPHDYPVETLKTQYRSVPAIGNIFSNFAYGGILKHARQNSAQRPLNIDDWLDVRALNIIKFPVSKYESIYRSRYLNGTSSYQIYSALFIFEFVKSLSQRLKKSKPDDKKFSVGIIAPYRAQANLIEKLFMSVERFDDTDILVGTVHTFQGDECDILFAVFNTPPGISSSPNMFLNRLNIVNVAISRARDYLFLVMPDDDTDKIENLKLVNYVKALFRKEGYGEFSSHDIEELIFGESNYIEEKSFSTGHQNVNVYTLPEHRYEIRTEDHAVDVQWH